MVDNYTKINNKIEKLNKPNYKTNSDYRKELQSNSNFYIHNFKIAYVQTPYYKELDYNYV